MSISSPTSSTCPHEYIMADGQCAGCSLFLTENFHQGRVYLGKNSVHNFTKPVNRDISEELSRFGLPKDICCKGNEIFEKIGKPTRRKKNRIKMLFFCAYSAYLEKNQLINPQLLGRQMGLSSNDISQALTEFSEVQTGYRPRSRKASPVDLIPNLCSSLHLEGISEDVIEILEDVIKKSPELLEEFPHKVAGGALKYFMDINGIQVPSGNFHQVVNFSDVTINNIQERIAAIHNN